MNDISKILSQIKDIRQTMEFKESVSTNMADSLSSGEQKSFSDLIKSSINQVNDLKMSSSDLKKAYERGDPNVSITDVMLTSQKASVGMEAVKQVRNKLLEAYKEVMSMPV